MKKVLMVSVILNTLLACQDSYLPGFDFSSFRNTPAAELAIAVEEDDYEEITEAIANDKSSINYQESTYGHSIIFLAVVNRKYEAVRALLSHNADISLKSYTDSADVLMTLCKGYGTNTCDTQMLNLLLMQSPDLSSYSYSNTDDKTSLLSAAIKAGQCLPFIIKMVEAGFDVNYSPDGRPSDSPVAVSVLNRRLDVTYYLLVKENAKLPEYCTLRPHGEEHIPVSIIQMLNEQDYSRDADMQEYKDKILAHLR